MIKIKKLFAIALVVIFSNNAFAENSNDDEKIPAGTPLLISKGFVAKITSLTGKALVERSNGQKELAEEEMTLEEGSSVMVPEGSQVTLKYLIECEIKYKGITDVTIQKDDQCSKGYLVSAEPTAVGLGAEKIVGASAALVLGMIAFPNAKETPASR